MMLLHNYEEQHTNIRKEIEQLDSLMKTADLEAVAADIAMHISRLAGILKIHLDSEDKYLYPLLEKSEDAKIRATSLEYQKEMGNLLTEFVSFKDQYNTKPRILSNQNHLREDYKKIVQALSMRMKKEEQGIYKYVA